LDLESSYLRLYEASQPISVAGWTAVTIDELAGKMDCTRRNAQFLIQRMKERGMIDWQPGRGRGNVSRIAFLQNPDALMLEKAQQMAGTGKLQLALGMLEDCGSLDMKERFYHWMGAQFGLQHLNGESDVLRFPFYRTVPDLEPMAVVRRSEMHIIRQIMDTLVEHAPGGDNLQPGLAHHWECDPEGKTWTFYLRKGVVFHHGKTFTADDVKFTFERMGKHDPEDWVTQNIRDICTDKPTRISFMLKEPNLIFAECIADERFSIVPADMEQLANKRDLTRLPVGTGPFRITENSEDRLVLQCHERYMNGRPFLDGVEMWIWPDYSEHLRALNEPAEVNQLLYFEAADLRSSDRQVSQLEEGSTFLAFNLAKPGVVRDDRLRQAIHLILDREKMIRELGGRRSKVSSGFRPHTDDSTSFRGFAPLNEARKLLHHSSYRGERLRLCTYEYESNERDAVWIQHVCKQWGIEIEIAVMPIRELARSQNRAEADMVYVGEVLGEEPTLSLMKMYRSDSGCIRSYLDPSLLDVIDSLLRQALMQTVQTERMALLHKVQEALKERYAVLFMYHSLQSVAYEESLNGMDLNAWGKIDYKKIWVK